MTCLATSMMIYSSAFPVLTSRPPTNLTLSPMRLCQRHRCRCMRQQLKPGINRHRHKAINHPPARHPQLQLVQRLTAERSEKRRRIGALGQPAMYKCCRCCHADDKTPAASCFVSIECSAFLLLSMRAIAMGHASK